ncbi:hypothetical protein [Chryseobacterium sp. LAM-KRS1]|uniref:HD domain-containing protein n=1 Tax=Chryseobacterium sp. LAM-KRS1 TaxID=2715754 RepID=UPI001553BC72|nr:hypothetical protein [Chryseobacterium sp. LAM-KRS1]
MNLKERLAQNLLPYTQDQYLINKLWQEIQTQYSQKGRFYHNLEHLTALFSELEKIKSDISDFQVISFAVFYHDIIYDASSKANEKKSAELAKIRLSEIRVEKKSLDNIIQQILATQLHQKSPDNDTNYLLDADLSILGQDTQTYLEYTKMIRREYSIYPDFLYKPGRRKVLLHFLESDYIFKTDYFKNKYEHQARKNIEYELTNL